MTTHKITELEWLVQQKEFLRIDKIEKAIGCPKTTLHYFVNGKRDLPDKWKAPLMVWVEQFWK